MNAIRKCLQVFSLVFFATFLNVSSSSAQSLSRKVIADATPSVRITKAIDESKRMTLPGHVPGVLKFYTDTGRVSASTRLDHMLMVLQPSSEQQHALRTLIDAQHDKTTASYHKWETPDTFQSKFGVSSTDIATVNSWLQQQGFTVEKTMKGGLVVEFSGNVGIFEKAFQTEFHTYKSGTTQHISINSDISIPEALGSVISAVPTVHNFFGKAAIGQTRLLTATRAANGRLVPELTSGTTHYVTAADDAVIYNTNPLLSSGITGTGITIGIVGRTDIGLNDVQAYRQLSGLPQNDPAFIIAGADPGVVPGDDGESYLDVEVSGGMAPGAKVDFVTSKATLTTDGITLSGMYLVENNIADIISESYGECEAVLGSAGNAFNSALWEQAAAQGISVFVSSGDNGPSACDAPGSYGYSQTGYSVSGDASTPYNVAVGGSMFSEGSGTYWNTANGLGFASVQSYIPETPWNESGITSGLWSGSGGISAYYPTPSWQRGFGVPTTDPAYATKATTDPASPVVPGPHRYLPDVAMNAASGHDGTLYCAEGVCQINSAGGIGFGVVGGTSVAAPTMAGVQALIDQANGGRQGLPTYFYYGLSQANFAAGLSCASSSTPAATPAAGCAFHDVTTGNNNICDNSGCTTKIGWTAGAGYDLATGVGTPNAYQIATQWPSVLFSSSVTALAVPTVGSTHGTPSTLTVTVGSGSGSGTPTGDVAFYTSTGAITTPINENTGNFSNQGPLCTLSGGTCTIQLSSLPAGSTNVLARYAGDGTYGSSTSAPVAVNIASESSVVSLSTNTLSCSAGTITPTTSFTYGALIYLDGNVAGASGQGVATGTMTITDGSTPLTTQTLNATGDVEMVSGVISSTATATSCVYGYSYNNIAPLAPGSHSLSAKYSGDSNYAAGTLATPLVVTVAPATLTTSLRSASSYVTTGSPVNFILTLTPLLAAAQTAPATGTVTFVDSTTSTALGSASIGAGLYANTAYYLASLSTSAITTTGAHTITATYSGDSNYNASSATLAINVTAVSPLASLTITSTATTFPAATANTLTVSTGSTSVSSGVLYFMDGSTVLGTYSFSSSKHTPTLATQKILTGGTHTITAVFNGSSTISRTTSPAITVTVTPAVPTVNLTAENTVKTGANVTLTMLVTVPSVSSVAYIAPTGTVQFYDGSTAVGSPAPVTSVPSAAGGYGIFEATVTTKPAVGVHSMTAVYSNDASYATTTSNIQTVKVYGAPVGNLDTAIGAGSGTTTVPQTDSLYVSGWAADPTDGSPLTKVFVTIDGISVGSPTLGISRPDVASSSGNANYANSGFALSYAASGLSVGNHKVSVYAANGGGTATYFQTINFTVTAGYQQPVGNLDQAVDSATGTSTVPASDSIYISGWAADPSGAALRPVQVIVDGSVVGTTTANGARPDVTAYPNSGFVFVYSAASLSVGSHTVTVSATNQGGTYTYFQTITINVTAGLKAPAGTFDRAVDNVSGDSPIHQSDLIYSQGWAADYQADGQVASVTVSIDGIVAGTATLGQSRPDVASAYSDPNWSTTGWYFVSSASALAPGTHTLKAYATDHTGLVTYFNTVTINIVP